MRKHKTLILVALLSIVVLTMGSVYAFHTFASSISQTNEMGKVKVVPKVYFQNGTELVPAQEVVLGAGVTKHGVYYVNITDSSSTQFIEKLRVRFEVQSSIDTYIRIKLIEQLTLTRVNSIGETTEIALLNEKPMDLVFENAWYNNRLVDDYFYYKLPIKRENAQTPTIIPLINKYYDDKYFVTKPLGYSLQIGIMVEAVQTKGGPENNWHLNNAPWGGSWQ